ncbi:FtsJ-like methyltransferase family protein [Perilla frutescens var. frutescens]|nr:FtsJ-like methyltransferase family protein [Perilla frutescens var. frutescens]
MLQVSICTVQLIQMQKQYQIISLGGSVLDLTCVPGAWLQGGVVVGIDTKRVKVPSVHCDSRVKTVCADVMTLPREQVRALSPKFIDRDVEKDLGFYFREARDEDIAN